MRSRDSIAQRVVSRSDLLVEIVSRIASLQQDYPVRVAIDGVDAAGKTTLARELAEPLEAMGRPVIPGSIDRFHHPATRRYRRGANSAEGYYRDSFDNAAVVECLLAPLGPKGSLQYRSAIFDYRTDSPVEAPLQRASPESVLLFDGVFLHRPELRSHWDFSIFLYASFPVTIGRAKRRDRGLFGSTSEVRRRYETRYVPGQKLYLAECQPEKRASLVINNDDFLRPVVGSIESLSREESV